MEGCEKLAAPSFLKTSNKRQVFTEQKKKTSTTLTRERKTSNNTMSGLPLTQHKAQDVYNRCCEAGSKGCPKAGQNTLQ